MTPPRQPHHGRRSTHTPQTGRNRGAADSTRSKAGKKATERSGEPRSPSSTACSAKSVHLPPMWSSSTLVRGVCGAGPWAKGKSASNNEDTPALLRAGTLRAIAGARVVARDVDRLVGRSRSSTVQPELSIALIESSQSAQRALVMLMEARQLLDEGFCWLPCPDAGTYGATPEQAFRPEEPENARTREPFD
jgi:hypothetical protein